MWNTYLFELRFWLRRPATYIYPVILFLIMMAQSAEWAGVFSSIEYVGTPEMVVNSPKRLIIAFHKFRIPLILMIPIFFGQSIYRDFRSNAHTLMYSFPINKVSYITAKALSAFTIVGILVIFMSAGFEVGAHLPGHDDPLVGPFKLGTHLYVLSVFTLPTVLFLGMLSFFVVAFSRNIYAGFITILLFIFIHIIVGDALSVTGKEVYLALCDPLGDGALSVDLNGMSEAEKSHGQIPLAFWVMVNRALWLSVTALLLIGVLGLFHFREAAIRISFPFRKRNEKAIKNTPAFRREQVIPDLRDSLLFHAKSTWRLAGFDLSYILRSTPFRIIMLLGIGLVVFTQLGINAPYGRALLPTNAAMLDRPVQFYTLIVSLLTFLYAGLLVQRGRMANMDQLYDVSSIPNWVSILSKFLTLTLMQIILLSLLAVGGISVQLYKGWDDISLFFYLKELMGTHLLSMLIWTFLSLFFHTLFAMPYLTFFLLLVGMLGVPAQGLIGLDHPVFTYNWGPDYDMSDLTGRVGEFRHFIYKGYWVLFGLFLLMGTYCWWLRGKPSTFAERFFIAIERLKSPVGVLMGLFLLAFLGLGTKLYQDDQHIIPFINGIERNRILEKNQEDFAGFETMAQPKISSLFVELDFYPEKEKFQSVATYTLVNRTDKQIDSILVVSDMTVEEALHFDRKIETLLKDTLIATYRIPRYVEVFELENGLLPGDSLKMTASIKNIDNTWIRKPSPVQKGVTALLSPFLPRIGYWINKPAKKPEDSTARNFMHESLDADWLDFEAILSTSSEEIALAPGNLVKEWSEGDRHKFHYKAPQKVPFYFPFLSGKYEVSSSKWRNVDLQIFHHPDHGYNLDQMFAGMRVALEFQDQFGPYPLNHLSIVEVPYFMGRNSASFPGLIIMPDLEAFLKEGDATKGEGANQAFFLAAHETAHQWWKLQLNAADALGAEMIMEGLCQYTASRCLEEVFGEVKKEAWLAEEAKSLARVNKRRKGKLPPLIYTRQENYLKYGKSALVMETLFDTMGEDRLNEGILNFFNAFHLLDAPYPSSLDLVAHIKAVSPDSLKDLVGELFETNEMGRLKRMPVEEEMD
ncbi:MAG: M1 family aminopeptidase [Bacteroidota bacterium]